MEVGIYRDLESMEQQAESEQAAKGRRHMQSVLERRLLNG